MMDVMETNDSAFAFRVLYARRGDVPQEHLEHVAEYLATAFATEPELQGLGPAFGVLSGERAIEAAFTIDAPNVAEALVKAAGVQTVLLQVLARADDAAQATYLTMELAPA